MRDNGEKYAGNGERGNVLHPWENFLRAASFSVCAEIALLLSFHWA